MLILIVGRLTVNNFPNRVGLPHATTSGLEDFEAPDPAEWCARRYVVVNVDSRGTGNSQGDSHMWGSQVSIVPISLSQVTLTKQPTRRVATAPTQSNGSAHKSGAMARLHSWETLGWLLRNGSTLLTAIHELCY